MRAFVQRNPAKPCASVCVQYVSVLRPPKRVRQVLNGGKTANGRNGDARGPVEGRRRVCSLTYQNSASVQRNKLHRRSLHNLPVSIQLNCSVEDELKRRRRLAGFDQSYKGTKASDSDSDPEFGEATEADGDEWKQVRERYLSLNQECMGWSGSGSCHVHPLFYFIFLKISQKVFKKRLRTTPTLAHITVYWGAVKSLNSHLGLFSQLVSGSGDAVPYRTYEFFLLTYRSGDSECHGKTCNLSCQCVLWKINPHFLLSSASSEHAVWYLLNLQEFSFAFSSVTPCTTSLRYDPKNPTATAQYMIL